MTVTPARGFITIGEVALVVIAACLILALIFGWG